MGTPRQCLHCKKVRPKSMAELYVHHKAKHPKLPWPQVPKSTGSSEDTDRAHA